MPRIAAAALAGLLLALAPGLPAAAQDAAKPEDAPTPRAPPVPEPKDAIRKEIQKALDAWFAAEPSQPTGKKGGSEMDLKGDRDRASGALEAALKAWVASLPKGGDPLRLVAWWRARLRDTVPQKTENRAGKIFKEAFSHTSGASVYKAEYWVSLPKIYKGKSAEFYPLVLTVLDKDADPQKTLQHAYGRLLETHVVVACLEPHVKQRGQIRMGLIFAYLNLRIDRERVTVDALGKMARHIDDFAPENALQFNGAVFRSPSTVNLLVKNLNLFPCAVLSPPQPSAGQAAAIDAIRKNAASLELVAAAEPADAASLARVADWIAALPPRRVGDQKNPYTYVSRSTFRDGVWAFWHTVTLPLDAGPEYLVEVTVAGRDPATNTVDIVARNLGAGSLFLNDEILDLDRPVGVRVNGVEVVRKKVERKLSYTFDYLTGVAASMLGPRDYFVTAVLPFTVPEEARIPEEERKAAAEAERLAEEERKKAEAEGAGGGEAPKPPEEPKPAEGPPPATGETKPGEGPPPTPAGGKAEDPPRDQPPPAKPADGAGKAPPVPPAPPPVPPVAWVGTLEEAVKQAGAGGRPLLLLFPAAPGDKVQALLDKVQEREEVRARLQWLVCARPPVEGDAGKPAKALLEAAAAGKALPVLLVLPWDHEAGKLAEKPAGTLCGADLADKDEAAAGEVLLKAVDQSAPRRPPVCVAWNGGAGAGKPHLVLFHEFPEKEVGAALSRTFGDYATCSLLQERFACSHRSVAGEEGKAALAEMRAAAGGEAKAPVLVAYATVDGKPVPKGFLVLAGGPDRAPLWAFLASALPPPPKPEEPKKEASPPVPPPGEKKEGPPAPGTGPKPADGSKPTAEPGK